MNNKILRAVIRGLSIVKIYQTGKKALHMAFLSNKREREKVGFRREKENHSSCLFTQEK